VAQGTVDSRRSKSGNKFVSYSNGYHDMIAYAFSDWASNGRAYYTNFWVGDTISMDRLTLNLGLRFDRQTDGVLPTSQPAVPGFERYMPEINGPAVPDAIVWNSVSPRASVSYALDESRKTLLRGSYALFASQLANGASGRVGVASNYRYIAFDAVDTNGNGVADYNEIDFDALEGWGGFDIDNPTKLESINRIGDYKVPKTHEVIIGVDRELIPNFGVGVAFTWRRMVDFNWDPRIGVTRAAYVQTGTLSVSGLPDRSSISTPYYALDPDLVADINAAQGTEYTARNGYHQQFWGIEVAATKRMSNRWMARFGFSTNTHTQYFDDPNTAIWTDPDRASALNGGLRSSLGRQRQERICRSCK
jgi:hypothetical protein